MAERLAFNAFTWSTLEVPKAESEFVISNSPPFVETKSVPVFAATNA